MQRRRHDTGAPPADQRLRTRHGPAGFSTWLAVVALLLQVVVPLGQAVPLPAGSDSPFRTLVICTGYGTRVLDQGGESRSGASPSAASALTCPVCTALGFCGVPAPAVAAPLPAMAAFATPADPTRPAPANRAPAVVRARGPPAAVV